MTIRPQAIKWLKTHHPSEKTNPVRTSRFYPGKEIWFFTFPATYYESGKVGTLNILCQKQSGSDDFHYLKVPFSFFENNKAKLDVRKSGKYFDLHISGKTKNWLVDERSDNVDYSVFDQ
jgi:hypothetical protein